MVCSPCFVQKAQVQTGAGMEAISGVKFYAKDIEETETTSERQVSSITGGM